MTISELLSLLQTIIALLTLIVSIVHVVHEMSKDEPRGKSTKRNDRP